MVRYGAFDNFLWLWVVPATAGLIGYGLWQRRRALTAFAGESPASKLVVAAAEWYVWARAVCVVVSVALIVISLARPQWGKYWVDQRSVGRDIIVALDVSRSMMAEDINPSRLERAKADIRDLVAAVEESGGHRLGLIAFAGSASVKCPLTQITSHFKLVLDGLGPRSVAQGGTLIGDCIRTAIEAFDDNTQNYRDLILITDGEDMDSYPHEAAAAALDAGISIYAIGLGDTEQGARIPITDRTGQRTFLEHEGEIVWSKMNQDVLRDIARQTGGAYIPAGTRTIDLDRIFRDLIEPKTKREMDEVRRERMHERFQWFLIPAVFLLILERVLRPVRGRAQVQLDTGGTVTAVRHSPTGYRGRQGIIPATVVLLNFLAAPAWGTTENARSLVAEGNRLFAAGKYEEAGQLYERAAEMAPDSPVPLFNRAASLFQQGDYAAATKLYEQARVQAPEAMRQQINYAMGNCHLQQAIQSRPTPPQALKEAQAATQYYRDSIPSGPTASDETAQAARHNLELTRRLIKQLEEQQAQQQEQQQEQQGQQQQQQQANQGQQQEQQQSQDQQRPAEGQEQQPQEGADQSRGQPQDQPSRQETSKAGETSDTAPEQKDSGNEKKLQQPRDAGKHMSSEEATDRLRSAISRAQAARSRRISEQQKKASGFRVEKDW